MAATAREIQIFKDLIGRGINQDRAKTLITESRKPAEEQTVETKTEPIGLAQRAIIAGEEFVDEKGNKESIELVEGEEGFIGPEQPEQIKQELEESDEGLTGFISETGEALKERGEKFKDIKERLDVKIGGTRQRIREAGEGKPFIPKVVDKINQSFKEEFNKLGSSFQAVGQVIGAGGDILWEGIENSIQEITPAKAEQAIENVVKKIGETETVKSIASSYLDFKENNPELARNIEATINISEILPFTKAGRNIIKETAKEVVIAPVKIPAKITAKTLRKVTPESISKTIAGIDSDTSRVLKETTKTELNKVLKQAQDSIDNVGEVPSPFAVAGKKAEEALIDIGNLKKEAGALKSKELKKVGTKTLDTGDIKKEFDTLIGERFNIEIDPKTLKLRTIPGEQARIKNLGELQDVTDDLLEIFTTDNISLKDLDAVVDRMQDAINFKKIPGKQDSATIKTIKGFIEGKLNKRLKTEAGESFVDANNEFKRFLNIENDLSKLLGPKGNRVEGLMKTVFSPQTGERTSKVFRQIKEDLGIDLIKESKLAKFGMEAVGDSRAFNLLNALDLGPGFTGNKAALIQKSLQSVFSPKKVGKSLTKKQTIGEAFKSLKK